MGFLNNSQFRVGISDWQVGVWSIFSSVKKKCPVFDKSRLCWTINKVYF